MNKRISTMFASFLLMAGGRLLRMELLILRKKLSQQKV